MYFKQINLGLIVKKLFKCCALEMSNPTTVIRYLVTASIFSSLALTGSMEPIPAFTCGAMYIAGQILGSAGVRHREGHLSRYIIDGVIDEIFTRHTLKTLVGVSLGFACLHALGLPKDASIAEAYWLMAGDMTGRILYRPHQKGTSCSTVFKKLIN